MSEAAVQRRWKWRTIDPVEVIITVSGVEAHVKRCAKSRDKLPWFGGPAKRVW